MATPRYKDEEKKYDFMYEILSKKFDRQNSNYNSLVTKGSFLFAFVGTFLAAYLGFVFGTQGSGIDIVWSVPGFLLFAADLYCVYQVLKPRTFKDPPPINSFLTDTTLQMDLVDIKGTTVASIDDSYKKNQKTLDDVADWFEYGLWCLFITFAIIILVNFYTYGRKSNTPSQSTTSESSATPSASTSNNTYYWLRSSGSYPRTGNQWWGVCSSETFSGGRR